MPSQCRNGIAPGATDHIAQAPGVRSVFVRLMLDIRYTVRVQQMKVARGFHDGPRRISAGHERAL